MLLEECDMIRTIKTDDKENLTKMINQIKLFTDDEKNIAVELIEEALSEDDNDYYNIFVYEDDGNVAGYHCTGKRALTDGVFDMYWIVVSPEYQNKGVGKKLLKHAEEFVLENNGRLLLAETSSQENYFGTRCFYSNNGYSILAEIKDFYKVSDNLIIFGKYLKI